jgi:hypothetical protein
VISEEFKRAFYIVVKHFGCSHSETNQLKKLAAANYEYADMYYRAEAARIDPAFGINERIKEGLKTNPTKQIEENLRLDSMTAYERAIEELAKLKVRKK